MRRARGGGVSFLSLSLTFLFLHIDDAGRRDTRHSRTRERQPQRADSISAIYLSSFCGFLYRMRACLRLLLSFACFDSRSGSLMKYVLLRASIVLHTWGTRAPARKIASTDRRREFSGGEIVAVRDDQ